MVLINLKDQRDIVKVVEYLIETHQKNNTVDDVMTRFGLDLDRYRMCCNLAMPAIAQGNMKGRFTAVRDVNRKMRRDLRALYAAAEGEEGLLADGVRKMYETYCVRHQNVVYGKAENGDVIEE